MKQMDIYQQVTDQIVAQLETGIGAGTGPLWHRAPSMPSNAISGKYYKGINVLMLWLTSELSGCLPYWATYRAWAAAGCQVRRGEKGTQIVFFKRLDGRDDDAEDGDERRSAPLVARAYTVFSGSQVVGWIPPPISESLSLEARIEAADLFFRNVGAQVDHAGDMAYFDPAEDRIVMPPFEVFLDAESYYAVLGHEHIHWTGHASRLARDLSGRFKSRAYAAEELVAEIGAAFVAASLGLSLEPRPDHACYLQSWLRLLKDDKRAIFTAAAAAQRAADLLWGFQPGASGDFDLDFQESPAADPDEGGVGKAVGQSV